MSMERTMEERSLYDYLNDKTQYTEVKVCAKVTNCETEDERIEKVVVNVPYEDVYGDIILDKAYMYDEVCDELQITDEEEVEILYIAKYGR